MVWLLGVTVSLSSGYNPQSNGQTERKIQIGWFLKTSCHSNQKPWNKFLSYTKYVQNSLCHHATRLTSLPCSHGQRSVRTFQWSITITCTEQCSVRRYRTQYSSLSARSKRLAIHLRQQVRSALQKIESQIYWPLYHQLSDLHFFSCVIAYTIPFAHFCFSHKAWPYGGTPVPLVQEDGTIYSVL